MVVTLITPERQEEEEKQGNKRQQTEKLKPSIVNCIFVPKLKIHCYSSFFVIVAGDKIYNMCA